MIVCDVVKNSVWFDPRVTKQISEYSKVFELHTVGLEDIKTNKEEINRLPGTVSIVPIDKKYYRNNRTFFTKVIREFLIFNRIRKAIINTKADVIHANDLDALVPAYYAAKKLKCKLIYDTHEVFLENHNIASSKFKKFFWSYFEKRIIEKVDCVVCVSNAASEYFQKKYTIKKTMVITNCAKKSDLSSKYKTLPLNEEIEVLNHGQFYAGRGYDLMIDAAKLSSSNRVKYVLRGFGSLYSELRQRVEENNLNNVFFEPPCKVYELVMNARRSHIGVAITEPTCLNFKLSISNKLFEYASAGLPVIMSNIPEHRFLNEKYKFGIVLEENTPTCLNDAINTFLNNSDFYAECSKNAIEMSNSLNWETEFSKIIELEKKWGPNKKSC